MPDDAADEKPEPDSTDDGETGEDGNSSYEDKSDTDVWVDRDKIDFDPDDGLLSGTAIEGGTEIPGPHESVDDVLPDDDDSGDSDSDSQDSGDSEDSGADDRSDEDRSESDGDDDEES